VVIGKRDERFEGGQGARRGDILAIIANGWTKTFVISRFTALITSRFRTAMTRSSTCPPPNG
jgi:hypothetical protein